MPRLRYRGPLDGVQVPLPDGGSAVVERGEILDTSHEHAGALLEQPGNWERADTSRRGAAKDAADTTPEEG